jgi:cell division protein FtsQ
LKKRAVRALAGFAALGAAGAAYVWGPLALRRVPLFAVKHVEVAGARLLAPHEVLAASGIRAGQSVWDDPAAWERGIARDPVVQSARVERQLPSGLRIVVVEKRPAALVEQGALLPATADGEVLPVDPARVPVDVPLLRASASTDARRMIRIPATRALLAETGRLSEMDPALMARVSEVRPGAAPGELLLALAQPRAEVRVPAGAPGSALRRLDAALEDVRRRAGTQQSSPVHVDLRFEDQVVVRFGAAPAPSTPATRQAAH